jgi:acetyl esterase/lipase
MRWFAVFVLAALLAAGFAANAVRAQGTIRSPDVLRDVPYGGDAAQTFDLYMPSRAARRPAPLLVMVHGGGWRRGDKRSHNVVDNKLRYWRGKGYAFASVNYRLQGGVTPLEQAEDVAKALAALQRQAEASGIDPDKIFLMGHSAGAHLVALLGADPALAQAAGARPWLGTVVLDSAALDVVALMERPHLGLYDDAFGASRELWEKASPQAQLKPGAAPFYLVCSTQRRDRPCAQALAFRRKALSMGVQAWISAQDLSHGEINKTLGEKNDYTRAVYDFMKDILDKKD